jgi:zinc resistance-associated protein
MLKPVIAATAALAIAGSTLVYAQQRFDGHGGFGNGGPRAEHQHRHLSPDDVAALGDARIAAMKAGLELTPDQAKNWPAFEQAVRNMVQLRVQRIQARQAAAQGSQQQGSQNAAPVTPFDRMSHRADSMTKRGAALKQIADAGAPLYASLNDAQKSRFTLLARMLRPHEHQHAMNGGGQRFGQGDGRGGQEGSGHRHVGQGGSGGPDGQGWGNRRFGQEGQDGQGGPDGQGWWGHHRFGQNGGMHNMSNSDNNSDDGSQL